MSVCLEILQDGNWEDGMVSKEGIPDQAVPADEIAAAEAGARPGRLYFTDGTKPNYDEAGKPQFLPGDPHLQAPLLSTAT